MYRTVAVPPQALWPYYICNTILVFLFIKGLLGLTGKDRLLVTVPAWVNLSLHLSFIGFAWLLLSRGLPELSLGVIALASLWGLCRLLQLARPLVNLPLAWAEFAIVLGGTMALRTYLISTEPLADLTDMLPLVQAALSEFTAGRAPYIFHTIYLNHLEPYQMPLTYLPSKWLAYLPAHLAAIDLRYTNLLMEAVIYLHTAWLLLRLPTDKRHSQVWQAAFTFLLLLMINRFFLKRTDTEMAPTLFVTWFMATSLFHRRFWIASGLLGIGVAMSQMFWLMTPFILAYLWTQPHAKPARFAGMTFTIAAALCMPFLLWSPSGVKAGLVDHWVALEQMSYAAAKPLFHNINFSIGFFANQNQWLLKYIQAGLGLGTFAWFFLSGAQRQLTTTLAYCCLAVFTFFQFNIVVWTYLYQPVCILLMLVLLFKASSFSGNPSAEAGN